MNGQIDKTDTYAHIQIIRSPRGARLYFSDWAAGQKPARDLRPRLNSLATYNKAGAFWHVTEANIPAVLDVLNFFYKTDFEVQEPAAEQAAA